MESYPSNKRKRQREAKDNPIINPKPKSLISDTPGEVKNKYLTFLQNNSIKPNNFELYKTALIHKSFADEHKTKRDYERLEFLGDSVLGLIAAEYLYETYPNDSEGELTNKKSNFVCENANYTYATKIGLDEQIQTGKGMKKDVSKSIIADCFESFLGAVYLDQGMDKAKNIVVNLICDNEINGDNLIQNKFNEDYKGKLQQRIQSRGKTLSYKVTKETGPDHAKEFEVTAYMDNYKIGKGVGKSKKEAEKAAAKDALENNKHV
ncbi:MAG: ribonuclease III [archaeon]|nr:ribonuclease III [archaeon]